MARAPRTKRRVAILGGGPAGLAAAFELTATPELRARHDVTVHVSGWRLGGRYTSGRNPDAAWRIEARGVPIWAGCDQNAFRLVRALYAELDRPADAPLADWRAAFLPNPTLSFAEVADGRWDHWSIAFDANDAVPGDGDRTPAPWEYVALLLPWMVRFFKATAPVRKASPAGERPRIPAWIRRLVQSTRDLRGALDPGADAPIHAWLAGWTGAYGGPDASSASEAPEDDEAALLEAAADLVGLLCEPESRVFGRLSFAVVSLLERFMDDLWVEWAEALQADGDLRRVAIALDLASAAVCGMIRDGVLDRGFDAIDDVDYTEWLAQNGARPVTLQSALVRVVYDYNFAFEDGDPARPRIAAGAALRSVLRLLFTYKGSVFFKLNAGPGEVLFAPLYQVLRARGVRFAFFHPVRGLHLGARGRLVERVTLGRQATVTAGPFAYEPLIDLDGLPCWPVHPLADQLAEPGVADVDLESPWSDWPDVGQVELKRGEDFDDIVLAVPLGAVTDVAGELIAASEPWREMAVGLRSVATRLTELWLKPSTSELGWLDGSTVLAAFAKPFDTWVDMSQLLDAERWPPEHRPGSIAWLVSSLPDDGRLAPWSDKDYPERVDARMRQSVTEWLGAYAASLWPATAGRRSFDWSLLVDPLDREGASRLDAQYWRANISPGSQVALSLPGSTSLRLTADGSGFDNLVLAGSWVRTGINLGTIEAAVTAGMQAARALCGHPQRIVGERDGE